MFLRSAALLISMVHGVIIILHVDFNQGYKELFGAEAKTTKRDLENGSTNACFCRQSESQ